MFIGNKTIMGRSCVKGGKEYLRLEKKRSWVWRKTGNIKFTPILTRGLGELSDLEG